MNTEEKKAGMKSAVELAMEKVRRSGGRSAELSAAQKAAIAEADRETKARIAEIEILTQQQVAEASARGEVEKIEELESEKIRQIGSLRERAEKRKDEIRKQRG